MFTFLLVFSLFGNVYASHANTGTKTIDSKVSSEERYVESLARQLNVTFEEAYEINRKENEEYFGKVSTRGLDEIISYKTVYEDWSLSNAPQKVEMAVEVKYVYSYTTGKALEIMNVGEPHMYIPGASQSTVSGGGYNKEVTTKNARISRTASIVYQVSTSAGISIGGDIVGFNTSVSGTTTVTTRAKTYVMYISLSDL